MVDRDRESLSANPGKTVARTGAFVTGALLCFAAPHVALAAAGLGSGCDSIARALKSAEIRDETLTIDIVDHMAEDHGSIDPVIGHEHDPTAPLLFLTPRVAHILQDVFGTETADVKPTPMERVRQIMLTANAAAKAQAPQPAMKAPVSGGGETATEFDAAAAEPAISPGPLAETFYDVDTLPRFQQRMYRNDI